MVTVRLAGIPVEVHCAFPENEAFLHHYRDPSAASAFRVAPTEEDRVRIREEMKKEARASGKHPEAYTDAYLENNALHALLAEGLVPYGVLMMHGSALAKDRRGYLFAGSSGAGKSTHARLWREAFGDRVVMVNDDKPLLRVMENDIFVCGSPWSGKHSLHLNAAVPLRSIAQIVAATENRAEPLSRSDAFQLLLRHAYSSANSMIMEQILSLESAILDRVRFFRLCCDMTPDAALVSWKALSEG